MALTSYINMYKPTPARITENLARLPPRLVRSYTAWAGLLHNSNNLFHFDSIPAFGVIDLFDNHIRTNAEHTFV